MDPANVKTWLQQHIADASRAPAKTLPDKRVLTPYMGFNKGGVLSMIYRDPSTKQYYAEIAGRTIGFFPGDLSLDALLTKIAERYVDL